MTAWAFEHWVEAEVAPDAAWRFWTDVANWTFDTSLEWVRLEPGFVAGARGVTKPRGADPVEWSVRAVGERQATIEMTFPGATLTFQWSFQPAGPGRTRITQQVTLSGPRAAEHARMGEEHLARGMPEGMRKLAEALRSR